MRGLVSLGVLFLLVVGCSKEAAKPVYEGSPALTLPTTIGAVKAPSPRLAGPGEPTLADAWPTEPQLAGLIIEEKSEGPWATRRLTRAASDEESMVPSAPPMAVEAGPAEELGTAGLGLVGTGRGGGGAGEGTIGLGSIGTIGKGSGSGSGRGYGAAPPAPGRMAKPANQGPLRAGSSDDNADLKGFVRFLEESRQQLGERFQRLDVEERTYLRVVDRDGLPVPGAKVRALDPQGRELWLASTYGDGRAVFYPKIAGASRGGQIEVGSIEALGLGVKGEAEWRGAGAEVVVTLPAARPPIVEIPLEVVFLIDTTGSMGDEIAQIKATLLSVTEQVKGLGKGVRLRYGAVLFRDTTDQYVTMTHPFTGDIQAFDEALQKIDAGGGGDYPESVNQGLYEAIFAMQWSEGAAKVVFLIGDAPPQMELKGDVLYGESLRAAVEKGVRVHSIAASGLDPLGSVVWRQVAQFTRGRFIFIEYGGDIRKSAAAHGVGGKVSSNNLDSIVFEQIRAEIAGWGKR
jgi:hypothetical protein